MSVALIVAIVTPTVIESRAIAQTPRIRASTVLTSANGQNLTQGMIDDTIRFGEFLAGEKFTPSEVSWIKDLAVKDFPKETASEIQSYNIIAKVLSEIRQLNNPVVRVQVREKLFTQIHLNQLAKGTLNEPTIMTLVYKHSPVIAADPTNKVVLTKRGLESYFEWHNFTQQLLGRPLLTNQVKAEALLEFPKVFHNIPLENKMMLAAAESHWLNLQQVWSKSSQEYKLQKVAQLREIVKNPKFSASFTLLNITLKSQVYSGIQNNVMPRIPIILDRTIQFSSPAAIPR